MSRPTRGHVLRFPVRGCHPLWRAFPDASGTKNPCHWPGPRSLATTDGVSLMSFPPATEMFQFAGFASRAYGFSAGYPLRGGLPHSDIPGSPIARISPGLFAACHVLHRLSVPRHPPDALPSRLSATPNGKNHLRRNRRFRRGDRRSVSFAESPGPIPVPPASLSQARHSSLLGGTCKAPPLEDTIGIPHAQTSRPLRRMDPASVTQLAYSHLSINNRPRRPSQPSGGNLFLHAAYRVRGCPRRAFRRNCVSPVGRSQLALQPWWR